MKFTKYIFLIFIIPIYCQFGKNIVQYKSFDWHYIQSKYFDVYFYDSDKGSTNINSNAEFVARESLKSYDIISNAIGWKLKNRIPIIVYNSHNDFQQTNIIDMYMPEGVGGVTELYKNRVVIPFDGNNNQFKTVIHHELVHAFINDYIYKGSIQNMQNDDVILIPLWMNEGLAEFLSTPWQTESDMWMRDLVVNGEKLPKLNELNGYLAYRGGQSVWKYIVEELDTLYAQGKTEAPSIIASIFSAISTSSDLNTALEKALDLDLESLESGWHKYIKSEYWPDINNRDYLDDVSSTIFDYEKVNSTYDIGPSLSPDKSKLAFYSNQKGIMSLCIVQSDCKDCSSKSISTILKSGMSIEFEELHVLKAGISWSPDSKKIIVASSSKGKDLLYTIDTNNNKKQKHEFNEYNFGSISQPIWHPIDESKIAFIATNISQSDIYLYDLKTKKIIQITNDIFTEKEISWSNDGKNILFSSDRTSNKEELWSMEYDLFKYDLNQEVIIQLTDTDFNEHYPILTNNDSTLIYVSDYNGINNLSVKNLSDSSMKIITNLYTGISQITAVDNDIYFSSLNNRKFILSKLDSSIIFNAPIDIKNAKWLSEINTYDFTKLKNRFDKKRHNYRNYIFDKNLSQANTESKNDSLFITKIDSSGNYVTKKYKTKFSLDVGQLSVGVGLNARNNNYAQNGLAMFQFSDILGDHKIYLGTELDVNFKRSDYALVYRYLPKLIDWTVMFTHDGFTVRNGYDQDNPYLINQTLYENISFGIDANRPLSRFNRIELNLSQYFMLVHDEKFNEGSQYGGVESSDLIYNGNLTTFSTRYVWDNTRWFYTYPNNGSRFYFKFKTDPTTNKDINLLSFDGRVYRPLFNGVSIFLRNFLGHTWGDNRQSIYLGSEPSLYSSNPYISDFYLNELNSGNSNLLTLFNFTENITPIRGVPFMYKSGDNLALFNFELRAPFLLYYFPAIKWFGQINGVLFLDIGVTWNNNESLPNISSQSNWTRREEDPTKRTGWVMSYGWGPRFIFLGMPLKLNFAWQYNPITKEKSDRRYEVTIGIDL